MIPLLGFAPDLDPSTPGILVDAENVIPTVRGMKGCPSKALALNNGLTVSAIGGFPTFNPEDILNGDLMQNLAGDFRLFVSAQNNADTTRCNLIYLNGTAWVDVTGATSHSMSVFDNGWSFAQFGNSTVAAQKGSRILRSQWASAGAAGTFATAGAAAPFAEYVVSASGFAIAFNTSNNSDEWHCSAYLDETDWTTALSTQSTAGRLISTPGPITNAISFNDGIIVFKRNSMYFGQYVGSPVVWQFDVISNEVGCIGRGCAVETDLGVAFVSHSDVYLFDGTSPRSIGTPIKEWLAARNAAETVHEKKMRLIWQNAKGMLWLVWTDSNTSYALVWNSTTNKWGRGFTFNTLTENVHIMVPWPKGGPAGASGHGDVVGPAVIVNNDRILYNLNGTTATAYFTTNDFGSDWDVTNCKELRVRYVSSPALSTAQGYYKSALWGQQFTASTAWGLTDGGYDMRQTGRWHRFKVMTVGDFEFTGFQPEIQKAGKR